MADPTSGALRGLPQITAGSATDVGHVREENEDAVLVEPPVFVVADGMGGHAHGEVASGLVVSSFKELTEGGADLGPDDVLATLRTANERMVAASRARGDDLPMGTTACGVVVATVEGERRWAVFNIGDSRVYRYADGQLAQVSADHSEVAEMVQAGLLPPDQVESYPRRNVVTRSLGHDPMLEVDLWVAPVTPGERYLLCTDGLTGELDDDRIATLLGSADDPQRAAEVLVGAAVEAGGHDNVTVAVVDVGPDPTPA